MFQEPQTSGPKQSGVSLHAVLMWPPSPTWVGEVGG